MIQRVFTLLLILSSQLFAYNYDDTIIKIEAKLFPKIALLEENIKKSQSKFLSITIFANEIDTLAAYNFKKAIETNYPQEFSGKKIHVNVKQFSLKTAQKVDAIIILSHTQAKLKEITKWANKNAIVSFSYDPYYLENGVLASIYIGKTTQPYLNSSSMKKYGFHFNAFLLQLCKFKQIQEYNEK